MGLVYPVVVAPTGHRDNMKTAEIVLVLCCVWLLAAEAAHIRSKAKLLGKLAARTKHHKRGLLSSLPPYKLGHDIPHVTHSVVKPIIVKYPPTASVTAVKVPLSHPVIRYPLPVGHPVPVSHPHYGLDFPHNHKTIALTETDHHFHHHHHHVPVSPPVPVGPISPQLPTPLIRETPIIPVGAVTEAHPVPAPPPVVQPAHVAPAPIPLGPPPLHLYPHDHVHFKTLLPQASLPLQPTAPVFPASPTIPLTSPFSYLIRPGNAVQTSYFANYPRYPLFNFQTPLLPFPAQVPSAPADHLYLERPQVPEFHLLQQAAPVDGVVEHHAHHHQGLPIEPTSTLLHPTQLTLPQPAVHIQPAPSGAPIDHDGWSPVTQPHDITAHHHLEAAGFIEPQNAHHFTQEQGSQVFEHHTNEQQFHDFQQLHHHIQQQIDQNQYDHNSNHQQVHQEYGVPQEHVQQHFGPDYTQQQQQQHDFAQHEYAQQAHNAQEYAQHAHNAHEYAQQAQNAHEYAQQAQNAHEYAQQAQKAHEYAQHTQNSHEYAQHAQNAHDFEQANQFGLQQQPSTQYGLPQNLGQEYGLPQQGVEGRSSEGDGEKDSQQLYHNHIPLGLQLPLDRPLEHFQRT